MYLTFKKQEEWCRIDERKHKTVTGASYEFCVK